MCLCVWLGLCLRLAEPWPLWDMVIEGEGCSSLPLPSGHCPWEQSWAHAWMVLALKRSPWELFLGLPCHSFLLLLVSAHGCHLDVWAWVCSSLGVEGPTKLCVSLSYTHTHARLCIFLRCCLFFVCFSYRCSRWWSVELNYVCCVLLILSFLNFSLFFFFPFLLSTHSYLSLPVSSGIDQLHIS